MKYKLSTSVIIINWFDHHIEEKLSLIVFNNTEIYCKGNKFSTGTPRANREGTPPNTASAVLL